jgi:ubiquinol-cytochrome c reductase iron-sulfur subunit
MSTASNLQLSKRDMLFTVAVAVFGTGVTMVVWPLIDQMNPTADILARSVMFELSDVAEGEQKIVSVFGMPVVVRHRSKIELSNLAEIDIAELRRNDPFRLKRVDTLDESRGLRGNPAYIALSVLCTREGCVLVPGGVNRQPSNGGWQCPCCGSKFDGMGRIFYGPAQRNLAIPRYELIDRETVRFI